MVCIHNDTQRCMADNEDIATIIIIIIIRLGEMPRRNHLIIINIMRLEMPRHDDGDDDHDDNDADGGGGNDNDVDNDDKW